MGRDRALLFLYLMFFSKINQDRGKGRRQGVKEGRANFEQSDLVVIGLMTHKNSVN